MNCKHFDYHKLVLYTKLCLFIVLGDISGSTFAADIITSTNFYCILCEIR